MVRCKTKESSSLPETERAYRASLRFLSYRPRSRAEVRQRLARRFTAHVVYQTLARLEDSGYLDDVAFARFWRENREAHRPRSAAMVKREIQQRGVARDVAEDAISGLDDEDSAYRAGYRRVRALHGLDQAAFRRRLSDYLSRRGFSFSVVRCAVERLWAGRLNPPEF